MGEGVDNGERPSERPSNRCFFVPAEEAAASLDTTEARTTGERFETFVSLIAQINRSIRRIKGLEMRGLGLRGIHVMILYHLAKAGQGLTQAELAELCGEDKATISRATTNLIDKHIVEPEATPLHSHRNIPLRLTELGRRTTTDLAVRIRRAVDAGGSGLCEQERDAFYHMLELVNGNLLSYMSLLSG